MTYEKLDGKFIEADIKVRDGYNPHAHGINPVPVKGINIGEAESKAIPIT